MDRVPTIFIFTLVLSALLSGVTFSSPDGFTPPAASAEPTRATKTTDQSAEAVILSYVSDFLAPISRTRVYPRRLRTARELAPIIVEQSQAHRVDSLLVAVVISFESAWNYTAVGGLGERGLMQVHGLAAAGWDMENPAEQVAAGVAHLGRAMRYCREDVPGALTRYGTGGECYPVARFVKWRLRAYRRAVARFRPGPVS